MVRLRIVMMIIMQMMMIIMVNASKLFYALFSTIGKKKLTFAQPLARELNEWQSPAINQE